MFVNIVLDLYVHYFLLFQAPSLLVLQICIPLMDYSLPKNGWSRYLNVLQCVLSPLIAVLVARPEGKQIIDSDWLGP